MKKIHMNRKIAFITGITGQDGSFLAEQLLEKNYKVYGLVRRSSTDSTWRINKIIDKIELITGDLTDSSSLNQVIHLVKPDEVYNLAAMSYVGASWINAEYTMDVNALGFLRLLEAIKSFGKSSVRIYQASSSEQFGKVRQTPQMETTPFYPRSPYGISKVSAHWIGVNYRESHKMFISMGICFNHESHRRGLEFLSRKVAYGVAKINLGLASYIELGNLDSERDFGYAPEYTDAMWKILQLDKPDDFVIATGEKHSIREFVQEAFNVIGITDWKPYIKDNLKYMRPAEVDYLVGNSCKAKVVFGWNPKAKFKELVRIMVRSDIERLQRGDKIETGL